MKTCKPWRKAADRKPRSHTVLLVGRVLDGNAGWPHAGGQRVLRGGGQLRQGRFHLAVGWKNTSIDKPGDCESMCSKSFTEVVSEGALRTTTPAICFRRNAAVRRGALDGKVANGPRFPPDPWDGKI